MCLSQTTRANFGKVKFRKAPTNFDNFGKLLNRTVKNDVLIQLSLPLDFYLLC